jgi:predicted DCC family thiol-disulfide oxidoreductase YuxK
MQDSTSKKVVLFDGVCNLCNATVQFLLKRDHKKQFFYASLQSDYGKSIQNKFNLNEQEIQSFIFQDGDAVFTKSTGALRVLFQLGGLWKVTICLIVIPSFIRDMIYRYIAKNRYKWFGKKESCWLPNPAFKERFLQ